VRAPQRSRSLVRPWLYPGLPLVLVFGAGLVLLFGLVKLAFAP
jgi:hypothetical protein